MTNDDYPFIVTPNSGYEKFLLDEFHNTSLPMKHGDIVHDDRFIHQLSTANVYNALHDNVLFKDYHQYYCNGMTTAEKIEFELSKVNYFFVFP